MMNHMENDAFTACRNLALLAAGSRGWEHRVLHANQDETGEHDWPSDDHDFGDGSGDHSPPGGGSADDPPPIQ